MNWRGNGDALRSPALLKRGGFGDVDHVTLVGRAVLLASLFANHGLIRGDTVAVLAPISTDLYEVLMGARHAGLVLTPLDPGHSLEQQAWAINASGARILIAAREYAALAEALEPLTPGVEARYGLDDRLPGHPSLRHSKHSVRIRVTDERPSGTRHYHLDQALRPIEHNTPDASAKPLGRTQLQALLGEGSVGRGTVLVESCEFLEPRAALLGVATLTAGGAVALPHRGTGIEVLRAAREGKATMLHLTARVAAEIAGLDAALLGQLDGQLTQVLVDAEECAPWARRALVAQWGSRVRMIEPPPSTARVGGTARPAVPPLAGDDPDQRTA